jgi:hypothetical protein
MKNLILAFAILVCSFVIFSCPTVSGKKLVRLEVEFSHYQTKVLSREIIDDQGRVTEEWLDTVDMTVLSDGPWKAKVFTVQMSEYPIPEAFQSMGKRFLVTADQKELNSVGKLNSPLYSSALNVEAIK